MATDLLNSRKNHGLLGFFKKNIAIVTGLIVLCVVLSFASPYFLTRHNIMTLLRQISTNAVLTLGMMMCIMIGGIDLSMASVVALSGTLTAVLISRLGMSIPMAIILGLASGAVCGLFSGLFIAYVKVPAFIATMAVMNVARGAAYLATNANPVRITLDAFNNLGIGFVAGVPLPVIYTIVLVILVALFLNKTRMGRYIYAVGGNFEAARYSGINVKAVQITVHVLSGFLAAFAGIVLAARMYSGQPAVATGWELDAVAASVLGGISLFGGTGSVASAMIGVLIIGVLQNGLNLLNVNSFWQLIVKGIVILIAVSFDMIRSRKADK
ncbi:MAG TPA: ABC transporter permease [Firmicutes bacterium]|jgi:ribose transport system permease protein|nr:ABC transporter permease [Bacillota bacterium]HHT43599.1 ABC transporter permease [Bacillota bacterium]